MKSGFNHIRFYEPVIPELINFHLRECETAGFHLTETRLPPDYQIPKHSHKNACFCFVLAGAFDENYGGGSLQCKPFSMTFSPQNVVHSNHIYKTGAHCFFLEFSPSALERAREYSLRLDEPMEFRGGALTLVSARLYREFCDMDEVSPLVIESLAFEIMAEVSRRRVKSLERTPPRWLRDARDLLHSNYGETLTLAKIASAVGVHPIHLARVFRRFYGCSVGEYLRRLRVENALLQLAVPDKSLTEIASMVGFADQAHFTRVFKDQTGLTPAQFRSKFY